MTERTFQIGRHRVPNAPWISPKVRVGDSPGRGSGLFAREEIPTCEIVIVWGGGSYTDSAGAAAAREDGRATMRWDEGLFSVEEDELDPAFVVNHSCDPNVWLSDVFTLAARRPIARDEELGIDYATFLADGADPVEWECRCGSSECRGRVTGADWRIASLRRRYVGHFTPLLSGRIDRDV